MEALSPELNRALESSSYFFPTKCQVVCIGVRGTAKPPESEAGLQDLATASGILSAILVQKKGLGVLLVCFHIAAQGGSEFSGAAMNAARELRLHARGEPAPHRLIQDETVGAKCT